MKNKIAFIKKKFTPFGGAENYMASVINGLQSEGFDIHVFASEWKDSGAATIHRVKNISFNSALSVLSFNKNVKDEILKFKPDCTISFERTTIGDIYRAGDGCHMQWLNIRALTEGRLKAVSLSLNPLHRIILGLEREIFKTTPVIIANSNMVKSEIMRYYGTPEAKISVIHNGVDLERFAPDKLAPLRESTRKELGIGPDTPAFLFVGTGYERKGLKTLINALPAADKSARLIVIGRGRENKFKSIAHKSGVLDRIMFLGPKSNIEKYYAAADIFVLPTIYDPFSNASLEAMAAGLPIITTANNGASELIGQGREGFITGDMLSPSELADKINRAIINRADMGRSARIKASHYPIEKAASGIVELIKKCIH